MNYPKYRTQKNWSKRKEFKQRFNNSRAMLKFAWYALTFNSDVFVEVLCKQFHRLSERVTNNRNINREDNEND